MKFPICIKKAPTKVEEEAEKSRELLTRLQLLVSRCLVRNTIYESTHHHLATIIVDTHTEKTPREIYTQSIESKGPPLSLAQRKPIQKWFRLRRARLLRLVEKKNIKRCFNDFPSFCSSGVGVVHATLARAACASWSGDELLCVCVCSRLPCSSSLPGCDS